jgi:xanthine dehydrogenase iron-sulfur cluster and FAD-binding subunit A
MTSKADFNAEEWQRVVEAPALAALRVVAADRGGTVRETLSMARAYRDAREHDREHGELLRELLASPPQLDPKELGSPADIGPHASQRVRAAIEILERKAEPADVEDYRRFVGEVAEVVARAHKEGGVLGIGGKEISPAEQSALEEIRAALGTPGAPA